MKEQSSFFAYPVFRYVVVPGALTLAYVLVLANLLPPGVNKYFANTLVLIALLVVASGMLLNRFIGKPAAGPDIEKAVSWPDLLLILLPLGPVTNYLVLNRDILGWLDIFQLVFFFGLASACVVVLVPSLLSRWGARAALVGVSLGLSFSITNMTALTRALRWHELGDIEIQLAILLVAIAIAVFLYQRDRKALYALCAVLFAAGIVQTIFAGDVEDPQTEFATAAPLYTDKPARSPDILLLTYDSYVENETMLQYGIDNSAQEQWLKGEGFQIYRGMHSVAAASIGTMGRVLGNLREPKFATAGDSPLFDQLEQAGYQTYGIFRNSYFFQGLGARYDVSFPAAGSSAYTLGMAILEGQFRHNADFEEPPFADFIAQKRAVMAAADSRPMFLYTHTGPNHSQNSGACRPDETALFHDRLKVANLEMREDVEQILAHRQDAIVIVNGDHGPYLTKSCYDVRLDEYSLESINRLDVQDRYGTFLAIRWPQHWPQQEPRPDVAERNLIQDLMPAILGWMYPGKSFDAYRVEDRTILGDKRIGGVGVAGGIIIGGADDGLPLFESQSRSSR